jgi:hypothetical protein
MPAARGADRAEETVDVFLATLAHPRDDLIQALRVLLRSADPALVEEVKWNAPSYRMPGHEHCATMQLRARDGVQLILHLGARKAALPDGAIVDPNGMLRWLGPDRAAVTFTGTSDLATRGAALVAIVRQWLLLVPTLPPAKAARTR